MQPEIGGNPQAYRINRYLDRHSAGSEQPMDQENKARELYEKISHWKEFQPKALQGVFDVLKSDPTRIEVVNKKVGALDIRVVSPDQFSVREPRKEPVTVGESEMLEAVKQWFGFPS
jgi:hypothetical protein